MSLIGGIVQLANRKVLYPMIIAGDAVVSALVYLLINNIIFGDKDYLSVGEVMFLLVPVALFIVVMLVAIYVVEKKHNGS